MMTTDSVLQRSAVEQGDICNSIILANSFLANPFGGQFGCLKRSPNVHI